MHGASQFFLREYFFCGALALLFICLLVWGEQHDRRTAPGVELEYAERSADVSALHIAGDSHIVIEAGASITLKVGDSRIVIDSSSVTIDGARLRLQSTPVVGPAISEADTPLEQGVAEPGQASGHVDATAASEVTIPGVVAVDTVAPASVHTPARAGPTKYALLIGIDEYKASHISDLRGAANDVELIRTLLAGKFQMPPDNIRVLKNTEATRQGIIDAIQAHLIDRAGPDDVAILHYSGHGSQMPDTDGDEIDELDETLVPHDGRTHSASGQRIYDIKDLSLQLRATLTS